MKKVLGFIFTLSLVLVLTACGSSSDKTSSSKEDDNKLVVGASNTPHAQILEQAKPILKEKGIDLKIVKYTDYVMPNKALDEGDLDANYFQHKPYLELEEKDKGYKFADVGAIHIEPMGLYSKKVKNIKDLKDGAQVLLSNSKSDWPRVIGIFVDNGLLTLKDGVKPQDATFDDIKDNPKNLKFKYDFDPAYLMTAYNNEEGDVVAINSNFVVDQGLNPSKDAIAIESKDSPYANIVVTTEKKKDDKNIKELVKVLHSKEIQDYITKEWDGAVVPVDK
ncbi:MetQ/NlpA family ABC transporter substrate-binding protein [Listeria cossartiae subsp. cayugensis]|uniref:MetQ/NlpA family ABC transporter substrate-binding protein n=1 Tax=Listeria cossartiae TaxID=2838249 RepID=UPI002880B450|nr:MetQ/NlpA family ABC transporter substrate-binding protein [Listeria cossartiae]MDT0004461.1 MetQ/NlpA family ABC transporter substrate-binding protein [Listeria cossartiae subsp. cayugensis]MDT0020698.1 MetQ/NlpA family ABC transporter substrate-binding protein [Listeria cossartiae subsp. cayugensis]MDT0037088.1 MetQ/NlpA family ABC transporter substrate-binding protein [Listeria cossartiae subsp. cayugensis]MDT0042606.1 MetQ/NlpA family ABC transporter substrate-binding protein [Listeria c